MRKKQRSAAFFAALVLFSNLLFCGAMALVLPHESAAASAFPSSLMIFEEEKDAPVAEFKEVGETPEIAPKPPPVPQKKEEPPPAAPSDGNIKPLTIAPAGNSFQKGDVKLNNSSGLTPNFNELSSYPPDMKPFVAGAPEVLVLHSHATESFMPEGQQSYTAETATRSEDNSKNMVAVGDAFTKALRESGISVMHDITQNDNPEFKYSYRRAAEVISAYLKKYPSIRVVVDLHRDSMTTKEGIKYKLQTKAGGDTAQVMVVSGCYMGGLPHPKYQENLKLAMMWQGEMNHGGGALARPIDFVKFRYNEHFTTGSLILECGTEANTLAEAQRGAEQAARSLAIVLKQLR